MSEPWKPPVYREVWVRPGYTDYVCERCGGFVENIIEHNRHHNGIDKLLNAVLALTKIIVPECPPGQLLEYLPNFPIIRVRREEGGDGTSESSGTPDVQTG